LFWRAAAAAFSSTSPAELPSGATVKVTVDASPRLEVHPGANQDHSQEGNPGSLLLARRLEFPRRTLGKL
jgi:hypothetical protein